MTHAALFAGIHVFSDAAKDEGIETVWYSEIDKFCNKIGAQAFPKAKSLGDIKTINTDNATRADIFSIGFPCQDISISGAGKGITGGRSSLWFEAYRVVEQFRPSYLVIENSPELLKKGFEKVLYPLSQIGYDVEWDCIRASDFGLPHKRERLIAIAYTHAQRRKRLLCDNKGSIFKKITPPDTLDTQCSPFLRFTQSVGKPAIFGVDDGPPNRLDIVERLASVGNAIAKPVARYIFQCIKQHYYAQ